MPSRRSSMTSPGSPSSDTGSGARNSAEAPGGIASTPSVLRAACSAAKIPSATPTLVPRAPSSAIRPAIASPAAFSLP